MKIILSTETSVTAMRLKNHIIYSVKGEFDNVNIDTWSHTRTRNNLDILYHNPEQYVKDPTKHVLFKIEVDGSNVVLSTVWWKNNPIPSYEILCLHVGRMTEMLLRYFSDKYIKFSIVG